MEDYSFKLAGKLTTSAGSVIASGRFSLPRIALSEVAATLPVGGVLRTTLDDGAGAGNLVERSSGIDGTRIEHSAAFTGRLFGLLHSLFARECEFAFGDGRLAGRLALPQ
jgi:hypothetical protein